MPKTKIYLLLTLSALSFSLSAQKSLDRTELLDAVVFVLSDSTSLKHIAREHPKQMEGCERYAALRIDFLPGDRRFDRNLTGLGDCLYGAIPSVLFFENIHEVVRLKDYKKKGKAYHLKFYVESTSSSTSRTVITAKVKKEHTGFRMEKRVIDSKARHKN